MNPDTVLAIIRELGVGTLLGTVIGWALTQFGQWRAEKREGKKALGRTLEALLEIRHLSLAIPGAVKMLAKVLTLSPEAELFLKSVLAGLLITSADSLAKRYDDSVTTMSETSPVLSFKLRSKHLLIPWLNQLRQFAVERGDNGSATLMADIEECVNSEFIAALEGLIVSVSWKHGWWTRWEVRRILSTSELSLPRDIEEKLTSAIRMAQARETVAKTPATESTSSPPFRS